jgi:hypothetical protein
MGMPYDLIWLAVPLYVILQVAVPAWSAGGVRVAAALPLVVMVPVFGFTAVAFAQESNLWPLLLLFTSPAAVLYLAVVALVARTPGAAAAD